MLQSIRQSIGPLIYHLYPATPVSAIVIGAQKSGTTSIWNYLHQHDKVLKSFVKEINFFSHDLRYQKGISFYHRNFYRRKPFSARDSLTIDVSPAYLAGLERSQKTAERIAQYNPDMKIIASLREPVARAFSAWNMYRRFYQEKQDWYFDWVREDLAEFPESSVIKRTNFGASFLEDMKEEIKCIKAGEKIEAPVVGWGEYAKLLAPYFQHFKKENILIVDFLDLSTSPQEVTRQIEHFLSLPPSKNQERDFQARFSGGHKSRVSEEAKSFLSQYYAPQNEHLFQLIGKKFDWG
ncbi:MAG: sulfotransferase domain-containing protein [Bacteroidota bacterium]